MGQRYKTPTYYLVDLSSPTLSKLRYVNGCIDRRIETLNKPAIEQVRRVKKMTQLHGALRRVNTVIIMLLINHHKLRLWTYAPVVCGAKWFGQALPSVLFYGLAS
jgi:hypothetical protein